MHLIVTQAFAQYAIGDRIDDADVIEVVLADNAAAVVKVDDGEPGTDAPPAPEPQPAAQKPASAPAPKPTDADTDKPE